MKINRIKINDLRNINIKQYNWPKISNCEKLFYEYINPYDISLNELNPGDIVRLSKNIPEENVLIYCDCNTAKYLGYNTSTDILIHKDEFMLTMYLEINVFKNTWPKSNIFNFYNVTGVWKTNINIDMFNSQNDIKDFYDKYNIIETFNNL